MELNDFKACIGENTRYYRELKQLSQVQLAHLSDLSETYICELEKGKVNATCQTLNKLANALGVEVEDLCRKREGGERKQ